MVYGRMEDIICCAIDDDSDREGGIIRFVIRCGICGAPWRSEPRRFSVAGRTAENENKQIIYDAMWEREAEDARKSAVEEAMNHFNHCPICKRLSCEFCFRICETIDMCSTCAEKLEEPGEKVIIDNTVELGIRN